jgi:hypothetical protein
MVKIAFVNFANGGYVKLQQSLKNSISANCLSADIFLFTKFEEIGSPEHSKSPYAFKIYAIEHVRNLGYDIVIWLDSCQRLVQDPSKFISDIDQIGIYLQQDGWTCGQWANDKTLEWFGVTRDDAMNISAIYACIIGFDFRKDISHTFIREWKKAHEAGLFVGKWNNKKKTESLDDRCLGHRHDQSCAELIAHKLSIPLMPFVTDSIFKGWIEYGNVSTQVTKVSKLYKIYKLLKIK